MHCKQCHRRVVVVNMVYIISAVQSWALPVDRRTSVSSDTTTCATVSQAELARELGEHRPVLQHFTPDSLCPSELEQSEAPVKSDQAASQLQDGLLSRRTASSQNAAALRPGCSAADLELLMAVQPSDPGACSWRLHCLYDEDRFPRTLYDAARVITGDGAKDAYCAVLCRPVTRVLFVLRLVDNSRFGVTRQPPNCPGWEWSKQFITVAFDCSGPL